MAGKALSLAYACLSLFLCRTTGAAAHSLEEVQQVFEQESIPPDLVEVTQEMEMTAGMKSVREQVHAKQHHILEQYVRARITRKCADSMLMLPRLDQEMVGFLEQGQTQKEQELRTIRDTTAAFIAGNCGTSVP